MKRLTLLFAFLCLCCGAYTQSIVEDGRIEIPIKGATEDEPILRGEINSPVRAFIYENLLQLTFLEPIEKVVVSIKNIDTGDVVFFESYFSPINVFIPWDIQELGNFQLIVESAGFRGSGVF